MRKWFERHHLAEIVEASHDAIIGFLLDGTITSWNLGAQRLYGYTRDEAIGGSMLMLVPRDRHDYWRWAAARLGKDVPFEQHETTRVHKDGRLLRISMTVSPMRDENGKVYGASTVARDIGRQKHAIQELMQRLRQQEAVAELGAAALKAEALDPLFDLALDRIVDMLDADFAKVIEKRGDGDELFLRAGKGWRAGLVGHATIPGNLGSQASYVLASEGPVIVNDVLTETRFRAPPLFIEHGVVSGVSTLIAGPGDEPFGVLGVHTRRRRNFTVHDINFLQAVANVLASAIRQLKARGDQELLLHELRHRIGNQFAQILALHQQTAAHSADIDELSAKFRQRVLAISAAHSALGEDGGKRTDLRALLDGLLLAYADHVRLDGPPVPLTADEAFMLALALNELVMNASKYGCFRDDRGALEVKWRRLANGGGAGFALDWRETSEAADIVEPRRESFGTRLIRMMIESSLHGSIDRVFEPTGLRLRMTVPLSGAGATAADASSPVQAAGNGKDEVPRVVV